jgi:hypothetical protein
MSKPIRILVEPIGDVVGSAKLTACLLPASRPLTWPRSAGQVGGEDKLLRAAMDLDVAVVTIGRAD